MPLSPSPKLPYKLRWSRKPNHLKTTLLKQAVLNQNSSNYLGAREWYLPKDCVKVITKGVANKVRALQGEDGRSSNVAVGEGKAIKNTGVSCEFTETNNTSIVGFLWVHALLFLLARFGREVYLSRSS